MGHSKIWHVNTSKVVTIDDDTLRRAHMKLNELVWIDSKEPGKIIIESIEFKKKD